MHVVDKLKPSAKSHELISAGDAPAAVAAWNTMAAELVKPMSTATNPAAILEKEKYLSMI